MTIRKQTHLLLVAALFLGSTLVAPALVYAGPPRTMPGPCGSVLPKNSRRIGPNRYHVTYHRAITGVLKMYRKYYGKKNPLIRATRLFALSSVVAYHLKSDKKSTGWAGVNIAFYAKRKHSLQLFVICRKK